MSSPPLDLRGRRTLAPETGDIRAMIGLNLLVPILTARAALPHLRAAGTQHRHAAPVGIAASAGLLGMPFYATYAATKAGLIRFDEAVRPRTVRKVKIKIGHPDFAEDLEVVR